MRVVIVGPAAARARLAARLPDSLEVVGEARTLAGARERAPTADAWIVAASEEPRASEPEAEADEIETETLTPRELDVLDLVAQGLSNKAIAGRLGVSDQTVKFHVASICGKLGAANRTDAAHRALRRGVIAL